MKTSWIFFQKNFLNIGEILWKIKIWQKFLWITQKGLFQDRVEDDDQEEEILNKIKGR